MYVISKRGIVIGPAEMVLITTAFSTCIWRVLFIAIVKFKSRNEIK